MNSTPLLTIAIPTWNRNVQVEKTVKSLVTQLCPEISVLVVDNCSATPVSETLCLSLKPRVRVVRNALNVGGPANVLRCFELADTKWVWILGDDDEPDSNAIAKILSTIASNSECVLLDFGHPLGRARSSTHVSASPVDAINWMYFPNERPQIFAWSDGHISNEILNRELLCPFLQVGYNFIPSLYPHVAMLLTAISGGSKCFFTGPPLAIPRAHNEAKNSYNYSQMVIGWNQLSAALSDSNARARYLEAINHPEVYGELSFIRSLFRQYVPVEARKWIMSRLKRS